MKLKNGIDISMPLRSSGDAASAWYVDPIKIEPVRANGFVGSVKEGGSVNFNNISFNPHGNGTHTECVGHIAPECYSINAHMKRWFFDALLITIQPINKDVDLVITEQQIRSAVGSHRPEALVLRTIPNDLSKLNRQYSNSNPAYLEAAACGFMASVGIEHLLLDLPSVDRESDGGALAAHRAFWRYPDAPRMEATITEFIYVPDAVVDGLYYLNLQVAPFENDASPSRPVLYPIENG